MYVTYYGANFRYPAAPTKPITGVVRDKDTKKPLVGVTIRSHTMADSRNYYPDENVVQTTTDKDGRYRLVGMSARGRATGSSWFRAAASRTWSA